MTHVRPTPISDPSDEQYNVYVVQQKAELDKIQRELAARPGGRWQLFLTMRQASIMMIGAIEDAGMERSILPKHKR